MILFLRCETLSIPGQSLIAAINEMETAEKGDNHNKRRKENRSDSYEDKFMLFLKNGENKVNLKSECVTNSEAEKEIDRMIKTTIKAIILWTNCTPLLPSIKFL